MRAVETKTAEQSQYTLEQVARRIEDMRERHVWGRLIVQLQDGVIVRLVREESEVPERATTTPRSPAGVIREISEIAPESTTDLRETFIGP